MTKLHKIKEITFPLNLFATTFLLFIFCSQLTSQGIKEVDLDFDEHLMTVTTLIFTKKKAKYKIHSGQGTGFFFREDFKISDDSTGTRFWLVSNRHVLYPEESFPDNLEFGLREKPKNQDKTIWISIKISNDSIKKKLRIFPDKTIDVAALDITNEIFEYYKSAKNPMAFTTLSSTALYNKDHPYQPSLGDDILAIGYPKGFYDSYNSSPIVKTGIIASRYGLLFRGSPSFAIDCKLFPGSSGSLIIAKPKEIIISNGQPLFTTKKGIYCLGIYSGEPYQERIAMKNGKKVIKQETFDLGVVYYADLIKELIGVK